MQNWELGSGGMVADDRGLPVAAAAGELLDVLTCTLTFLGTDRRHGRSWLLEVLLDPD